MSINPFAAKPTAPPPPAPVRQPASPTPAPAGSLLPVQDASGVIEQARQFYKFGLGNGETTHWACLDEYWSWLKKEISICTGYPNHGKSRFFHHVMLIKSAIKGWKFAVYVPENETDFYVEMAQMLVGMTANPTKAKRMSMKQMEDAISWLLEHFFVVTAPDGATPGQLLSTFEHLHRLHQLDGVLIDPWNQLDHDFQSREDLYLSDQLGKLKRFAIKNDLAVVVTAHPAGNVKDKNGTLIRPDAYSISGGKMWNNKMDNVFAVFRPSFPEPDTEVWLHKIKKQGRVGMPGTLLLTFDRETSRYKARLGDAQHPLETVSFNAPGTPPSLNDFPQSQFDTPATVRSDTPPF